MEQLILHIEYLLQYHDCVILPGLGAFLSIRRPAEIDNEAGVIRAPYKEVCFNPSITHNDGMIANSIARRNGLSYSKAISGMELAIEELQLMLRNYGEVRIGSIGRLEMQTDGRVMFRPELKQGETVRFRLSAPQAERLVYNEALLKNPDYWYIPVHKKASRIAASITAVATIGLLLIMLMLKPVPTACSTDRASVVPVEIMETNAPTEVDSESTNPTDCRKENVVETEPEQKVFSHYLIVATFRTEKEARAFINQHDPDISSLQILEGGKLYRVAYAGDDDAAKLQSIMRNSDFKKRFHESWIWKR